MGGRSAEPAAIATPAASSCDAGTFPFARNRTQSLGLDPYKPAATAEACLAQCCANTKCTTWNFNADFNGHRNACFIGSEGSVEHGIAGWVGGSKFAPGPPNPSPPHPPPPHPSLPHPSPGPKPHPPFSGHPIGGQRAAFQPLRRNWPFVAPQFDDTAWAPVDMPHDFVINGSFHANNDAHRAFLARGVGLYRKHFNVPLLWQGAGVQLVFDAALQYTEIYLNGQHVADHRGGYTRFTVRLDNTSALRYGAGVENSNVLAVRTDARWGSGHWYACCAAQPVLCLPGLLIHTGLQSLAQRLFQIRC